VSHLGSGASNGGSSVRLPKGRAHRTVAGIWRRATGTRTTSAARSWPSPIAIAISTSTSTRRCPNHGAGVAHRHRATLAL